MSVEILDVGPCKKRVKVNVSKERVAEELAKSYREVGRSLALKGFRRGHVPVQIIQKRFGKGIEQDVRQNLIQEMLSECIEENELKVIGEPSIDGEPTFDASQDPALTFEATVQVRPEFELPSLDGIRVVRPSTEATDAEVLESLEASRRMRADTARKEGDDAVVAAGDMVLAQIDYLVDGESARSVPSSSLWVDEGRIGGLELPELGARLAGAREGDQVELACKFPPELMLGGDEQAVRVTINEVHTASLPALDDAFAKDAGFDDLDELKAEVRAQLMRRRGQRADAAVDEAITEELLKRVDFPVPEDIVEGELDELAVRAIVNAQMRGMPEEEAKAEGGKVRASSREDVERRLKALFLLDKIAADRKVFATEDEVEQAVASLAMRRGRDTAEVRAELEKNGMLGRLRYELRLDKTRTLLRSKAEVIDAENR